MKAAQTSSRPGANVRHVLVGLSSLAAIVLLASSGHAANLSAQSPVLDPQPCHFSDHYALCLRTDHDGRGVQCAQAVGQGAVVVCSAGNVFVAAGAGQYPVGTLLVCQQSVGGGPTGAVCHPGRWLRDPPVGIDLRPVA